MSTLLFEGIEVVFKTQKDGRSIEYGVVPGQNGRAERVSCNLRERNWCVSYPKSGKTWLMALIKASLSPVRSMPCFWHDTLEPPLGELLQGENRDVAMESEMYKRSEGGVLLIRDPRDVAVSYFYWKCFAKSQMIVWPEEINEFVLDKEFGVPKVIGFMNRWLEYAERTGMLVITYEDLKIDAKAELSRIYDYWFGKPITRWHEEQRNRRFIRAQEWASFTNMKNRENVEQGRSGNAMKTRKGRVGGYKDELSERTIEELDEIASQ